MLTTKFPLPLILFVEMCAFVQYTADQRTKTEKVRTLLVAIFGVRFIMVGMEVVVPLVTSRMRDAAAKIKTGSAEKV